MFNLLNVLIDVMIQPVFLVFWAVFVFFALLGTIAKMIGG